MYFIFLFYYFIFFFRNKPIFNPGWFHIFGRLNANSLSAGPLKIFIVSYFQHFYAEKNFPFSSVNIYVKLKSIARCSRVENNFDMIFLRESFSLVLHYGLSPIQFYRSALYLLFPLSSFSFVSSLRHNLKNRVYTLDISNVQQVFQLHGCIFFLYMPLIIQKRAIACHKPPENIK